MTSSTTPITPEATEATTATPSAALPDTAPAEAPPDATVAAPPARKAHGAATAQARQELGAYGERVAARYLVERGLLVLDRNWRCDEGEIDLVLRDGSVLVVCEVKTRSSTEYGTPHEAITDTKLERLRRLGQRWAHAHDKFPPEVRVDLVAVIWPAKGAAEVDYVRGIG